MDDSDDLEAAVRELSDTLEQLRTELRRPPTGPLGLPQPPKPGELLRFTEQYTIPALVSLLDASVRVLELLAAAIRVADVLEGALADARTVGAVRRPAVGDPNRGGEQFQYADARVQERHQRRDGVLFGEPEKFAGLRWPGETERAGRGAPELRP